MDMRIFPASLRSCGAAFVLAISLASPLAAAPASGKAGSTATATPAVRIDNFARVDDRLYRGAQPEGRDFADLKALGVKTIVNLTSDDADPNEQAMVEAAGLTYVHIPMSTHTVPTSAQLTQFLGLVNDPASGPVYVHCVGGRHRTGVMTAAYRMTHHGWTGEQAFKEMKQYKYGPDFLHSEFKAFVYSYRPEVAVQSPAPVVEASSSAR
jgi:protein tyrosine/serine phosphatase